MQKHQDGFYLDPLEGQQQYPDELAYTQFIGRLPSGRQQYQYSTGRTEFRPQHPLVVGLTYDLEIIYLPERTSLQAGDKIKFSIPRTWTQPQNVNADAPGFVTAARTSGQPLRLWFTQNTNLQWWICLEIIESAEPCTGAVRVGYQQVTIQRFPQKDFVNWRNSMRTIVEDKAGYAAVPTARTAKPLIQAAPPARFWVTAPAVARPGETISLRFSTLDYCNNRAHPSPTGEVFAALPDNPYTPLAAHRLRQEDKGSGSLTVTVPDGSHARFVVSDRQDRLTGMSPHIVISEQKKDGVFFGDIHAKTIMSDGLKTPDEFYEHARDVALLDFAAIADHNCEEASWIEGPFSEQMSEEDYALIQKANASYNEPGRFATIEAFEQNNLSDYPGHRNVYFRDRCPGLFRGKTAAELYAFLAGHKAMVIPHHTNIWKTRVHLDNPDYARVIEMYSMHCTSERKGTPINNYRNSPGKEETGQSAQDILDMGYKVGFIAASDNHNGAPGLSARPSRFTNLTYAGGLAAVFAPELTREAIFDGMYNRRCYATTGERIYLEFFLDNQMMGSDITAETGAKLHYRIKTAGTSALARVELVSNCETQTLGVYNGTDYRRLEGEITVLPVHRWFYARVTQVDRHMAWSSPIFVTPAP